MTREDSSVGLSMVMMEKAGMRSAKTFCQSFQKWIPDLPASVDSEDRAKGIWVIKVGPHDVYLTLMPAPVPWSQLETLTQAAWHWRESPEVLKNHKAHILIAVMNGPPDPIDSAVFLTQITAAILEVQESLGVLWGGPAICSRKMFLETAKDVSRENPAVLSWVSFNLAKDAHGVAVITQGMEKLGHKEMELLGDPGDGSIIEFALDMAMYVLRSGPVLKHGQTFGRSANELFPITHRPWSWDKSKTAIVLDTRKRSKPGGFMNRLFGK